jgi:CBS domain containing-hemolysin-like protein
MVTGYIFLLFFTIVFTQKNEKKQLKQQNEKKDWITISVILEAPSATASASVATIEVTASTTMSSASCRASRGHKVIRAIL